jgi:hypothetical protein
MKEILKILNVYVTGPTWHYQVPPGKSEGPGLSVMRTKLCSYIHIAKLFKFLTGHALLIEQNS